MFANFYISRRRCPQRRKVTALLLIACADGLARPLHTLAQETVAKDGAAAAAAGDDDEDAQETKAAKRQRLEAQRQAGGTGKNEQARWRGDTALPTASIASRASLQTREDALFCPAPRRRSRQQVLQLCNERFLVPEALFHPSDIGLNQAGIAEAIAAAVKKAPQAQQELLFSNVLATGGCANMPGFEQRLASELRPLVPDAFQLGVRRPPKPELAAWRGAAAFAATPQFQQLAITREEYFEKGPTLRQQYADHPVWPTRGRHW